MKYKLALGALVGVLAIAASAPVFAQGETESESTNEKSTLNRAGSTVQKTVDNTVTKASNVIDTTKPQSESVEERKATLRAELKQMRDEAKQKLEGRRLAQCQNRQANINELINKSVSNGRERLTRIQKFEAGVRAFYEKKQLDAEQFATVSADVDAKEAAATAALDVMDEQTFECTTVDGAKPSDTIKATHEAKRKALDEYRASVRAMIKAVKAAFAATQTEKSEGEAQ